MKKPVLSRSATFKTAALAGALLAGLGLASQAQAQTQAYQHWPLTRNNQDSAAVRSVGLTATTPTLRRLVVSDGSAAAQARPYSTLFGQAVAPQAVGTGWSTSSTPPGPGGTLRRTFYEQFTVTAAAGATVRADSVIVTASFLNTNSSTNLAVVYSRSNFSADSTDVTGGKGPAGTLPATANGSFATPIALANVSGTSGAANVNTYRLALNGANGVTLNAGQTLTIRMYFSCSSTGASARFALLKNVIVKSRQTVTGTRGRALPLLASFPNPVQDNLQIQHPASANAGAVAVYSATGQRVARFTTRPGSSSTELGLAQLPAGIYLVEYQNGSDRLTSRIVKQ